MHVVLDAPDQVLEGRVVFIDDRPLAARRVLDQQVDPVALDADRARVERRFAFLVGLGRFVDRLAAFEDVLHDLVEVLGDIWKVVVMTLDLLDQVPHCQAQCFAAQLLDRLLDIAAPARKFVEQVVQLFVGLR